MTGSNRRPSACKADALPAELILRINGDPYGIRTRVTAVKGRCLNRLTKGPFNLSLFLKTINILSWFFIGCNTFFHFYEVKAPNRIRTGDLFLTMEVLYLLSYGSTAIKRQKNGSVGRTRTCDPLINSQMLLPTELQRNNTISICKLISQLQLLL